MEVCMDNIPVYIKIDEKIVVTNPKVYIKDIAKIHCRDSFIEKSISNMVVAHIKEEEDIKIVYSIMYIIDKISKQFPNTQIFNLGEENFIIEYLINNKKMNNWIDILKVLLLSVVFFFGSGFTIMTFNSDVDVAHLFDKLNRLVLGTTKGHSAIQIAYSIGIGVGILLFFNHFTTKRAKLQPSPIHVEMRSYEENLNQAIIEDASRDGTMKDRG
jgi:stage V sporulation protein AA